MPPSAHTPAAQLLPEKAKKQRSSTTAVLIISSASISCSTMNRTEQRSAAVRFGRKCGLAGWRSGEKRVLGRRGMGVGRGGQLCHSSLRGRKSE
jgi:hypothetical protein